MNSRGGGVMNSQIYHCVECRSDGPVKDAAKKDEPHQGEPAGVQCPVGGARKPQPQFAPPGVPSPPHPDGFLSGHTVWNPPPSLRPYLAEVWVSERSYFLEPTAVVPAVSGGGEENLCMVPETKRERRVVSLY
jgi:hypothetical protein